MSYLYLYTFIYIKLRIWFIHMCTHLNRIYAWLGMIWVVHCCLWFASESRDVIKNHHSKMKVSESSACCAAMANTQCNLGKIQRRVWYAGNHIPHIHYLIMWIPENRMVCDGTLKSAAPDPPPMQAATRHDRSQISRIFWDAIFVFRHLFVWKLGTSISTGL